MHAYHDQHRYFPMAAAPDKQRSWRVTLLPFLNRSDLYEQYDQNTWWNSTVNLPLAHEVVAPFDCVFRPANVNHNDQFLSAYAAVTGPGASFETSEFTRILDFTDGASNTLMVVEACGTRIIWTEPRDVRIDRHSATVNARGSRPHTSNGLLSSYHVGGAQALMADGSVRFISNELDPAIMNKIVTRSGEPLMQEELP